MLKDVRCKLDVREACRFGRGISLSRQWTLDWRGELAQVESGRVDGFERPQEREERECRLRVPSCWLAQPLSRVLKAAVSG